MERNTVRLYITSAWLVMWAFVVAANGHGASNVDTYSLQSVKARIAERSAGLIWGPGSRHISGLGDKVAIAITKIYKGPDLTDPQNVRVYLPLIREAFKNPQEISDEEDRNPSVTMLLLGRLAETVTDTSLGEEISGVEALVLQSAKLSQK